MSKLCEISLNFHNNIDSESDICKSNIHSFCTGFVHKLRLMDDEDEDWVFWISSENFEEVRPLEGGSRRFPYKFEPQKWFRIPFDISLVMIMFLRQYN